MKYDIIIIGSGLGGLECGFLAAQDGKRVLVLEQGTRPGGCMQSYRRRDMTFDTGLHYIGGLDEGQSLHEAFSRLGLLDLPWQRLDPDSYDIITIGNNTFGMAQGFDNYARRLAEYFPAERSAIQKYVNLLRWTAEQPLPESLEQNARLWNMSAWDFLNTTFDDPLLIDVISGASLKMELRRKSLPLFSFLFSNSCFVESSWRLNGGGSMIVDRLVQGIRSAGGDVVCKARVSELVEKDERIVRAVCTNGEAYEAEVFISGIHPASTCMLLKRSERMKALYRRRMGSIENTFGAFTVSLRIRPNMLRYFNFNRYIYSQPDVWAMHHNNRPVRGVFVCCRIPEDGSPFTRQVDLITPMAWEDCMQWQGSRVGKRGGDYRKMKQKVADECIALAEPFMPGIRSLSKCSISTPLTWHDYTLTPQGCAYGTRKDCRNPLLTVLTPRTPVPNLFMTGQSLALHGVHGVTATAFRTYREVMKLWN
ncbi:MAG: phytoene desaturase family protein [Prevotella sp.]